MPQASVPRPQDTRPLPGRDLASGSYAPALVIPEFLPWWCAQLMLISWKEQTKVPAQQTVPRLGLNQMFTALLLVIPSVALERRCQGGGPMTL